MNAETVLRIFRAGLLVTLLVSAGPMIVGMAVAFVISLFQATTQLQERTLSDVPKLVAIYLTLGVLGYWMLSQMVTFTRLLFESITLIR